MLPTSLDLDLGSDRNSSTAAAMINVSVFVMARQDNR